MKQGKAKKRFSRIAAGILILLLIFLLYGLYNPLSVSKLELSSPRVDHPIRIALISDLHSCQYGEAQAKLIDAVIGQEPDLVCLVGDLFDDRLPNENTELFLTGISARYPCYFVTGNHDCFGGSEAFQEKLVILDRYGIIRLSNESKEIELNGQSIRICGVDDPSYQRYEKSHRLSDALDAVSQAADSNSYTILLSHRPEYFPLYCACGFDLVLCGHAHGGQWRIPGLLENGLFAPNQGFFPRYTGGIYTEGITTMVVSRGLAKESTRVPRLYNRPEIVMIEVS